MGQLTDSDGVPELELAQVLDRLIRRFPDLSERWLSELARTVHEGFRDAPIRTYVPLLMEHQIVAAVRRSSAAPLRGVSPQGSAVDWTAATG